MVDLQAIADRWAPVFNGFINLNRVSADELREKLGEMAEDIHDLLKLALEVRAYGKARIALSDAHTAWVAAGKPLEFHPTREAWHSARAAHRKAIDRIEALAVQLAGGDVAKVCKGDLS